MKNIIKIISACSLLAILSSCGIYGKYERTGMESTDSLYRTVRVDSSAVMGDSLETLADFSWKDLFTDPKLQVLIQKGLDENADLNIARLKVEQAEARLVASKASYAPSVLLNPQGQIQTFDPASGTESTKSYDLAIKADWEVDLFGKVTNEKRQAQAVLEGNEAYRQAVMTRLISNIASTYYQLLMLDRQLEISDQTLVSWDESIKAIEALKNAGLANESAILQAKANRLSLAENKLDIQQKIQEMENSLSVLLALPPQEIERGRLEDQHFPDEMCIGVPAQLLANRPDVKQAEARLKQAFYGTNEARSAFYPNVKLSGKAGWTNLGGGTLVNPGKWLLSAIGSLVQPVFSKGKNYANLKVAEAEQEAASLSFQQSLLQAGKEVNDALSLWQTAREQQEIGNQKIEYLEEVVRKTGLLMKYSSTNYLEVLVAEQSLLAAEMQEAKHQFDEIYGVISLYHSLGGGVTR